MTLSELIDRLQKAEGPSQKQLDAMERILERQRAHNRLKPASRKRRGIATMRALAEHKEVGR